MTVPTMSRPTWRVLRTELLRSVAVAAAAATLLAGAQAIFLSPNAWAGRWMELATEVRMSLLTVAPIAVACAAWHGGRERRRRLEEQLDATPRPRWQPVVVGWLGVTLGCWLGLLMVVGVAAGFVAPVATYSGGGWGWVLAGAFVSLAAVSALGIALGRLIPYRLAGPVAAIVLYSLQIYAHDDSGMLGGFEYLAPIQPLYDLPGTAVDGRFLYWQTLWFAGLAATALVLAGARRRVVAVLPATLALVGVLALVNAEPSFWRWPLVPDPAASEPVCTEDEPEVCLPRAEAFALDDVTPVARDVIERLDGLPGAPIRAENTSYDLEGSTPARTLRIGPLLAINGELRTDDAWTLVQWHPPMACRGADEMNRYFWLSDTARMWALNVTELPWDDDRVDAALSTLQAMPAEEQRQWVGALITAGEVCDTDALAELAETVS